MRHRDPFAHFFALRIRNARLDDHAHDLFDTLEYDTAVDDDEDVDGDRLFADQPDYDFEFDATISPAMIAELWLSGSRSERRAIDLNLKAATQAQNDAQDFGERGWW